MFDAVPPLPAAEAVSALQRTTGSLDLAFAASGPARLGQAGALKVRLPAVYDGPPQAIIINTAGGLTGGDRLDMAVTVEAGAALTVSGQACEKLYKSAGGTAKVTAALKIEAGATLEWLMQPAILFDRSCFKRRITVDITETGSLLAVEALVFGRTAMDEQVRAGSVAEHWRIRRGATLIYADAFRLDGDMQAALARPSVMNGAAAMASILYVGIDAPARCTVMRAILDDLPDCMGAASAWNGLMSARLVAADGYLLTRGLVHTLTRFRNAPLPRPWMI